MKYYLRALLSICLCVLLLAGCGAPGGSKGDEGSSSSQVGSVQDAVTEHTVLLTDQDEEYTEYQVVYSGADTKTLKMLQVQVDFRKDAGYTQEFVDAIGLDEIYPNISTMDFASKNVYDDGDCVALVLLFEDLDDPANLKTLHDNGIIQLADPSSGNPVSGESYIEVMTASGAQEVSEAEAPSIHYAD